MIKLYLAIPCYNEEEVLRDSAAKLLRKYETMMTEHKITFDSRIVFIDDGSRDRTWQIIEELHRENPVFQGIKLTRNRGHQNALLCGLMTLKDKADAVISIDADLQDDIEVFDEMVAKFEEGCDVVYGVRSKRETDTFFKRFTAEAFYKILNRMGAKVIFNHADFRLMSSRALEAFSLYKETNIFLRGMVPMIGYRSDIVTYERSERLAGESKYPLKKMLALAWEGITSLSIQPCHDHLFADQLLCRRCCQRLGKHALLHLGARRSAAAGDRYYRRIYRQNLFGSQAPSAVYRGNIPRRRGQLTERQSVRRTGRFLTVEKVYVLFFQNKV